MIKKIYAKIKSSFKTTSSEHKKIDFNIFYEKYKSVGFLDKKINEKILYGIANNTKYIYITEEQLNKLDIMLDERNKENERLSKTAELNNKGIANEKKGNINAAIANYEKNIKIAYPATHSYERLMILYRKQKNYEKEIKVIEKAVITQQKIIHHVIKRNASNLNIIQREVINAKKNRWRIFRSVEFKNLENWINTEKGKV